MLVLRKDDAVTLPGRQVDRHDLGSQTTAGLGSRRLHLARQGEAILRFAINPPLGGDIFRGLRHRIDAERRFHRGIDQSPAKSRVLQLLRAGEGSAGLAHDIGRARHALDAARDDQLCIAGADRLRGDPDRV